MDRFFSSIFFLLLTITLYGQVSYPRGLNPPKVKWNQIETDKVQIIFPTETEPQAQRAANLIHMLYDSSYYALGPKREKVSIIIQNQTTLSNGFVTVGPFRSEFFTTPPQFNFGGSVSWMDMLTIHEYRHVEQYANAKKGITKIGSILYGENGWGGAAGLALPRWFWEGDAVFAETALTPAGRGRLPDFDKEYRSLLLSGKRYGYEKAAATSLKDFVPNHYNLGYYLTTQLRLDHGNDVWRDVMADAVDYKGVFFPFSQGIKKKSGGKTKVLYARTMDRLTTEWETEKEQLDLTTHTQLTPAKKVFTDIKNPTYTRDGTLIYEKRGFNTISTFHELRDGKERKLLSPGFFSIDNATISVSNSKMVWSELRNDERWGNQNFSVIMSFDLDQKSKKRLTSQTKYFSPALSPEGNRIIAVHSPENAKYALHLLDSN
ncbi:MAG: hypothetical protein KI790_14575, partial [Cyclobacteriaceae bacterium]|nr:hypothetical protein [Cyclobacteriaceae bacterium HetDA_MAG_MS6]